MILYLLIGPPASGKSTYGKNILKKIPQPAAYISKDEIRIKYFQKRNIQMTKENMFSREETISRNFTNKIQQCINGDINCIIDSYNNNPQSRAMLFSKLKLKENDIIVAINFRASFDTCLERNAKRPYIEKLSISELRKIYFSTSYVNQLKSPNELTVYNHIVNIN